MVLKAGGQGRGTQGDTIVYSCTVTVHSMGVLNSSSTKYVVAINGSVSNNSRNYVDTMLSLGSV